MLLSPQHPAGAPLNRAVGAAAAPATADYLAYLESHRLHAPHVMPYTFQEWRRWCAARGNREGQNHD